MTKPSGARRTEREPLSLRQLLNCKSKRIYKWFRHIKRFAFLVYSSMWKSFVWDREQSWKMFRNTDGETSQESRWHLLLLKCWFVFDILFPPPRWIRAGQVYVDQLSVPNRPVLVRIPRTFASDQKDCSGTLLWRRAAAGTPPPSSTVR